jgi:hypothetical protein
MRYQNGIIAIVGFVLAAVMAVGTVYSDQFPQASAAESIGFDALAHDLLGELFSSSDAK